MKKPVKNSAPDQVNVEQQTLKESEERFRLIFENSPVGKSITGIDGSLRVNKAFCDILGYSEKELKDKKWTEITHPDDIQASRDVKNNLLAGISKSMRYEKRYLHKNGNVVWTDVSTTLQRDSNGNPLYFITVIIDINDRVRIENELRQEKFLIDAMMNNITDQIYFKDLKSRFVRINRALAIVLGLEEMDQAIGKTDFDFFSAEHAQQAFEDEQNIILTGKPVSKVEKETHLNRPDTWVSTIKMPLRDKEGNITGTFGISRDVTERKAAEDNLKQRTLELDNAVENLRRSNQELEQFAYVASHDLQEPLRMVASYTQLLERRYKDKLDQDAIDFINYAVDGANRMQRLINDLLEFSRVTTKGKPFTKVDLSAVLGQAVANLRNKIQETGSLIVNEDLPFAYGDEGQIVRVFQNLLDNAIKFKGESSPRINVTSKIIDGKVQISISDNGIGIDKIYSERVFTIFQRLHTKADYPGTGIGLAICKRTIERHGGTIWFESEPGIGTTFNFTLNIK